MRFEIQHLKEELERQYKKEYGSQLRGANLDQNQTSFNYKKSAYYSIEKHKHH